mmetsp:Transcript_72547/g.210041  ORF Transcript_72547/g.210041 Transcript_72547/m.210041 type:complete len:324 (+) Transcript_72547:503-1474(+)
MALVHDAVGAHGELPLEPLMQKLRVAARGHGADQRHEGLQSGLWDHDHVVSGVRALVHQRHGQQVVPLRPRPQQGHHEAVVAGGHLDPDVLCRKHRDAVAPDDLGVQDHAGDGVAPHLETVDPAILDGERPAPPNGEGVPRLNDVPSGGAGVVVHGVHLLEEVGRAAGDGVLELARSRVDVEKPLCLQPVRVDRRRGCRRRGRRRGGARDDGALPLHGVHGQRRRRHPSGGEGHAAAVLGACLGQNSEPEVVHTVHPRLHRVGHVQREGPFLHVVGERHWDELGFNSGGDAVPIELLESGGGVPLLHHPVHLDAPAAGDDVQV